MDSSLLSTDTTIDHLGLIGRDIGALREVYQRLGFTVTRATPVMQPGPDGKREVSLGHVTAHIAFAKSQIELVAVRHPGQGNHLDQWLARGEGLRVLGLHADDVVRASTDLVAAGLIIPPVRRSSRLIFSNGVNGMARFRWIELPESVVREAFACVVEHETPEIVFDPRLTRHPNGAIGIRSAFAVVANMEEAFKRYQRLPGTKHRAFAIGRAIVMNQQQVIVLEPAKFGAMFPGVELPPPPHLGGLALTVTDIAATRAMLTDAGVAFNVWGDKGIWLRPADCGGAVLVFVDQSAPL